MEDVIFYLIVAGAVIVNIVRNYQKVSKENKNRDMSKPVSVPRKETQKTSFPKASKRTEIPETSPGQESRKRRESVSSKPNIQPAIPSFNYNYESLESLDSLETIDIRNEEQNTNIRNYVMDESILENEDSIKENSSIDLQLSTQEDLKRAFVHSLVFERKY